MSKAEVVSRLFASSAIWYDFPHTAFSWGDVSYIEKTWITGPLATRQSLRNPRSPQINPLELMSVKYFRERYYKL